MNREVHVRFWEGAGLRCPALLDYLHAYRDGREAQRQLAAYFDTYNRRRLRQSLDYQTPDELHFGVRTDELAAVA